MKMNLRSTSYSSEDNDFFMSLAFLPCKYFAMAAHGEPNFRNACFEIIFLEDVHICGTF